MFVYSAFSSMLLIVNTYPYTIIYVMEHNMRINRTF